ncbi:MAG: endolytic transglycosylase MltG [Treponema sp.]|nr:endolytic transglycosylase MltG [Treponema sp.]
MKKKEQPAKKEEKKAKETSKSESVKDNSKNESVNEKSERNAGKQIADKKNEETENEVAPKQKKHRGAIIFLIFVLVGFIAVILGLAVLNDMISPVEYESGNASSQYVTIPTGMSVRSIAEMLKEKNLIKSSKVFYYIVRFPNLLLKADKEIVFKSGVYEISPAMDTVEIIKLFVDGKQAFVKTSIPEGLTTRKIARLLDQNKVCDYDEFIQAASNQDTLKKFGIQAANCEGYLFPDTYYFYPNMDANEVVSMMIENFFENLQSIEGQENATSIDYTKLILASIVEREYRVDEEAPLIASVFLNRMDVGMGLESCATIEYIITEIQGKPHPEVITYKDLKIDSPYNTYKWSALPPGPISNPGKVAISAVLNPAESNFYYFTLTDSERGSHTFSRTLKAHARATAEFRTKKVN